ncbi:MlaE family ABC transporter permease [Bordetella bronchialis]|uniref:ABC transporter permease n=1 Tax=Bordetella bronchialis TaxID=463025 RepID=A0A193G2Z6_9BORD|nr:ABC transporter permease [Bordetella bronchialis]ANN69070.1 ABC transporter permease [Bordetella bronchialis]ANN74220.1 ABC transporter permease [Bordetella bronchialis]
MVQSNPHPPAAAVPPFRLSGGVCYVSGDWTVHALARQGEVQARCRALEQAAGDLRWDLNGIDRLDTVGANLIWHAWGDKLPGRVRMPGGLKEVFDALAAHPHEVAAPPPPPPDRLVPVVKLGEALLTGARHGYAMVAMLGQLVLDLANMIRHPARAPWREISAQIYRAGAQALGITALVGFLIGVVISYLSSQQLQTYGADRFIVRLLGTSIVRELGPVLAAILVAGRSGSAFTAQIGVMRVTQELDAMAVMGISHSQRLILPRVVALAVAMPLLVVWTDAMALLGGMLAARAQLGVSLGWFLDTLPDAVTLSNYGIGLAKGATFGVVIALVACYFGLNIEPNTESLGRRTTTSVVTSITGVILVDALYAILLSGVPL